MPTKGFIDSKVRKKTKKYTATKGRRPKAKVKAAVAGKAKMAGLAQMLDEMSPKGK